MPPLNDFFTFDEEQEKQGTTLRDLFLRPTPELRTAPAISGYVPEPQPPEPSMLKEYGPQIPRLAGAATGMIAGSFAGHPMAGAAIGGMGGEALSRYLAGEEQKVLPTLAAGAGGMLGAVVPGAGNVGEAIAQGALLNYGSTALATLADRGELPSGAQTLTSLFLGGAGGGIAGRGPAREMAATARATEQAPLRQGIEEALQPAPAVPAPAGEDLIAPALARLPEGEVLPPVQDLMRTTPAPTIPETATSSPLRQGQETLTPPAAPLAPVSPTGTLLAEAQETVTTGRSPFLDAIRNQRGEAAGPVIAGVARGGLGATGGGIAGSQIGDTEEERQRNAMIGMGLGAGAAVAGGPLISRILKRGSSTQVEKSATPIETVVRDLGQAARTVEYGADTGDFRLAHGVADEALRNLDTLKGKVGEITPDNRLFRVVADTLLPEGAEKARNLETVSGAARVLQRYSDLAQRLSKMADGGDQEAAQLLNTLYGGDEASSLQKVMNFWRGSLVGRISTQVRNAGDQGVILWTSMLDRLYTGTIEGLRTGKPVQGVQEALTLGATAARRIKDGIAQGVHLAAREPDRLQRVLDHYPEFATKLLQKPEGLEGHLGQYMKAINAGNELQESFYRRVYAEAYVVNGLRRAGIDPGQAFRNPDMIPDTILEKSLQAGLKGTLQVKPSGTSTGYVLSGGNPNTSVLKEVSTLFQHYPVFYGIAPFPRYLANRLQYVVDHSPAGLVKLFTEGGRRKALEGAIAENQSLLAQGGTVAEKAQFNIDRLQKTLVTVDSPAEIAGKALTGTTMIAAGVALRSGELAGEHWWEVKIGDKRLDMRPFSTVAGFMFMADYLKGKLSGKEMSREDFTQGLAVMGTRAGVGLTLMDLASGRGDNTFEGVANLGADLLGMFGAGFFNPVSQTKDLVATAESLAGKDLPEEAMQRDYRDDWQTRLYGPTLNQIPFASRLLPERASPTSSEPKHFDMPLAHFFGANVSEPNAIEQAIGRLGVERESIYPRDEDRAAVRTMTRNMGPFVEQMGEQMTTGPGFARLAEPLQERQVKKILEAGRKMGLAGLLREDPQAARGVIMRRKDKTVQEMLRGR